MSPRTIMLTSLSFIALFSTAAMAQDAPQQQDKPPAARAELAARAEQLFREEKWEEGAAAFKTLTQREPNVAAYWHRLGYCLHVLGKLDEALSAHLKAAEFAETRALGHYNAACVHAMRGDKDKAFAALDAAIDAGFVLRHTLENDGDMKLVRDDPRMKTALARIDEAIKKRDAARLKVAVVIHEGVELLDFAGPAEVFEVARTPNDHPGFAVFTVAPSQGTVETNQSVKVVADYAFDNCPKPDILVVPGGATQVLTNDARAMKWIRETSASAKVTLTVCTGVFTLAQQGLLDGMAATTHHSAVSNLRKEHPKVDVRPDAKVVDNGRIVTAAGVSSGIDGALHVVAKLAGENAARRTAQYLEYEWRPLPQTPMPEERAHGERGTSNAAESPGGEVNERSETLYRAAVTAAASGAPQARVLDSIGAALEAGACPTRTLTQREFAALRSVPRFRELIRDHTRQSETVLTPPDEPGEPMRVRGVIRDPSGAPISGALVYAFHTDARGLYSPGGMDETYPRIFGYMKADDRGSFAFKSIRPAHYPDQSESVEQHIHWRISAPGYRERNWRTGFRDDPFWKQAGRTPPHWTVPVSRGADGMQTCEVEISLERG